MILSHYMPFLYYLVSDTTYRLNRQYSVQHLYLRPAGCTWHPASRWRADLGITPPEEDLYILSWLAARVFVHPAATLGRRFRRLRIRKSLPAEVPAVLVFCRVYNGRAHELGKAKQTSSPSFRLHPRIRHSGVKGWRSASHQRRSHMAGQAPHRGPSGPSWHIGAVPRCSCTTLSAPGSIHMPSSSLAKTLRLCQAPRTPDAMLKLPDCLSRR